MATRERAPLGAPIWIDLTTSDVERAQQFYGAVFGWTFETAGPEYGGYVNAAVGGRPVAGLMRNDPQWNAPDAWTTYLHTADADATVAAAVAAGGQSCVATMDIPDKGRMALLSDPGCGFFGLWQPAGHDGYEAADEAGAPAYFQLTTRDYAGSLDFYRTVFGWNIDTVSDTDEFRYSTASFNGVPALGVMDGSAFLPEGVPATWTVFFGSDDVDKTIELIVENGGSVVRPAEDTPYGRLAAVTDPTGAAFNLTSLPG
ncbi:hydroxylase [Mycobacterium sp. 852013-50091_SCH5140682]|uniref:VOC family protein n=1 Tax=Mycobacterium sp. 852013-50091_SCH5140682 TaxID=1834109 RepID=UPI0007EA65E5|nr:VOC family protein [Mycobacterium sp. 852013-50091_SCH5140682]OBC10734.1 hydroxylase [Mycobacterium sp. 852013-50091_SCH5140682]